MGFIHSNSWSLSTGLICIVYKGYLGSSSLSGLYFVMRYQVVLELKDVLMSELKLNSLHMRMTVKLNVSYSTLSMIQN